MPPVRWDLCQNPYVPAHHLRTSFSDSECEYAETMQDAEISTAKMFHFPKATNTLRREIAEMVTNKGLQARLELVRREQRAGLS